MQKSLKFLYTNNKISEKEIKKTIPFTIASKTIKYLRINLTKEVKDLYTENHKTLMKEIKEETTNGKMFQVHVLEELILLKCSYFLKPSIYSMQSLSHFQRHFSQK